MHRTFLLLVFPLLIGLQACNQEGPKQIKDLGIASPIALAENDTTLVLLEDYLLDAAACTGVEVPANWSYAWNTAKDSLYIFSTDSRNALFYIRLLRANQSMDILCVGNQQIPAQLQLADKGYSKVQMKGEMTNWGLIDGQLQDGTWVFDLLLNPNAYQYIFVADGQELLDPVNQLTADNGSGGINSLLDLRPSEGDIADRPILQTHTFDANQVQFRLSGSTDDLKVYVFQYNQLLGYNLEDGILSVSPDAIEGRSKLRVFASNAAGISNDILVPLQNGIPVQNKGQLTRTDYEAQVMYFTLVDRFFNGNTDNDEPVDDPRLYDKANYQGGDLAGITAKIKSGYFDSLGINSIWLSPITQNPAGVFQEYIEPKNFYSGYHGYWPISSSKIDHRFGTDEEMYELVQTAHQHDIAILLDYVCNHVHEQHPIIQNNPEFATVFELGEGRRNLRLWDEQRLTTWFDEFLPSLDLENPAVVDLQVDSTMYWINKFEFDGFRHDATKHIAVDFWRQLTRRLKEERVAKGNQVYQIGETYGSRDLVKSYIGSGLLDAQFDFNLYFDSRSSFAFQEPSFEQVTDALAQSLNYFGHHNTMGYMTGNHDQARFISYAGGALRMDEDPRAAGFEREVGVGDPIGYKRLQLMTAFYLSIPGVPTIFYGDEIGMPGANDPDNRDMMIFEGLNADQEATKAMAAKMTNLRRNSMSLIYGDTRIVSSGPNHIILERTYFDEVSYCVFHKGTETESYTIELDEFQGDMSFSRKINESGPLDHASGELVVELEPWSFEIIQSN